MFTIDFQIIITYPSKQNHQRLKYNGLSLVLINRNIKLRVVLHVGLPTISQRPFVYISSTEGMKEGWLQITTQSVTPILHTQKQS